MFRVSIALAAGMLTFATVASADPVAERVALMDQVRMGAVTLVPMIKGKTEFDAQKAELALRMSYAASIGFNGPMFPQGSTHKGANNAIWDTKADFDTKRAEFVMNAKAAVENLPKDLESLISVYQPMLDNCAACHKTYRIKDN